MSDAEIVRFVLAKGIGLVGIGPMKRMIAKAYRVVRSLICGVFLKPRTGVFALLHRKAPNWHVELHVT